MQEWDLKTGKEVITIKRLVVCGKSTVLIPSNKTGQILWCTEKRTEEKHIY